MKVVIKRVPVWVMTFLIAVVFLIGGCGSGQKDATSTDLIVMPADGTLTVDGGGAGKPCYAGLESIFFAPLTITVTDSLGSPRNNVNVDLYTDGFWYTDKNYNVPIDGVGPFKMRTVTTGSDGKALVYWSTELMPPANPPTGGGTTDGTDLSGNTYVQAYSGVVTSTFTIKWTVKGCKKPA